MEQKSNHSSTTLASALSTTTDSSIKLMQNSVATQSISLAASAGSFITTTGSVASASGSVANASGSVLALTDMASTNSFNSTYQKLDDYLERSCLKSIEKYKPSRQEQNKFDDLIKKLNEEARNLIFHKKEFQVGRDIIKKTVIYHFFESKNAFDEKPKGKIQFVCIVCNVILHQPFGVSCNLTTHLKTHSSDIRLKDWFKNWDEYKKESANENGLYNFFLIRNIVLSLLNR